MKRRIKNIAAALLAGAVLAFLPLRSACGAAVSFGQMEEAGNVREEHTPAKTELKLNAQSAVILDLKTGRILYGKEENTKRPMASTTKIMTCILALEQGNMDDLVEVSALAASMPDVQMGIREGERYRLEDLLYSLMLESHNDSAVAVAEHIGGSVEGFAGMMNQKARDIGCRDTFFVTPNGLDGEGENGNIHSTTAADLALIMRYCVYQSPKREEFLAITRTQSRTVADETGKRSFYLANHNALLSMMPEALSGKTGFTAGAGYCYVAALEDGNKAFAVALLGCGWPPHKTYKWEDMRVLANYAFNSYEMCEIFERGKEFPRIPVKNGRQDSVSLSLNLDREEQTLKVLLKEGEKPVIRYEYPKELEAPVEKGMAVGSVFYSVGGKQVAVYPIYTAEETEKADYLWYFRICLDALAV